VLIAFRSYGARRIKIGPIAINISPRWGEDNRRRSATAAQSGRDTQARK
jgi:hypothetical protein